LDPNSEEFAPEWDEVYESFDSMGLHENLLRGIYAYGAHLLYVMFCYKILIC
jgi:translation initiation factor 4A